MTPPGGCCRLRKLLVVADDFTGACDAAGPFGASHSTLVSLTYENDTLGEPAVVAVDLDVRERSDADALRVAHEVTRVTAYERVYLKIDSTLRGPIDGLLRGALLGTNKPVAVIAPAFPEQGRLFSQGRVVANGVTGASLLDMLGHERTALLAATFARSAADVARAVDHARMRGAVRVVVDVDDPECLSAIALAWQSHPEWLLVGSGGLTRHLVGPSAAPELSLSDGPVVVVAGSPHDVTRTQFARLPSRADLVLLQTPPPLARDAGEAAAALADEVLRLSSHVRPRGVILAGGTTARYTCHRLAVRAVRLVGELSPGMPVGYLQGGPWDGVAVVTKAGGFGAPDALLDAARALGPSSLAEP